MLYLATSQALSRSTPSTRITRSREEMALRRGLLICSALLVAGVAALFADSSTAARSPQSMASSLGASPAERLAKITPEPASERRIPPGRACPPNTPGCLKTPGATTYASFLEWVARNVDRMYQREAAAADVPWSTPRHYLLSGSRTARTNCGGVGTELVTTDSGPFWCGLDRGGSIYLTMSWLKKEAFPNGDYKSKDFALAFVVAHEWAHHAQYRLLFTEKFLFRLRSIHVELMADCLAGVWAKSVYHESLLEPGDFDEAVALSKALGDYPGTRPTSEGAHGTAKQRSEWLRRGYESASGARCRTWESKSLPSLLPP